MYNGMVCVPGCVSRVVGWLYRNRDPMMRVGNCRWVSNGVEGATRSRIKASGENVDEVASSLCLQEARPNMQSDERRDGIVYPGLRTCVYVSACVGKVPICARRGPQRARGAPAARS